MAGETARLRLVMPHATDNCRVKELWTARSEAANGFWQKILPEGHVRQLVFGEKLKTKQ
jgi:hypothetical protein